MTGNYFDQDREAKLLIFKENLLLANSKLEDIEAGLHNNPNIFAKLVLRFRKYRYADMKLEAEGRIQELEY